MSYSADLARQTRSQRRCRWCQTATLRRSAAVVFDSRSGARAFKTIRRAVANEINDSGSAGVGQTPVNCVVLFTSATLVEVELTGMVPIASGVGKSSVPPAPCDS